MRQTGVLALFLMLTMAMQAKVQVTNLRVENLCEPMGIDTTEPRFSWVITADKDKDVVQTAYEIAVDADGRELWRSGRVESNRQLWIPYEGTPLKSGQHCTWRVRVYTNQGDTGWSQEQRFSIGLLNESHWRGYWIGLEHLQEGEQAGVTFSRLAARYLRKVFTIAKERTVRRATAYVCGLGVYRLFVNGQEVGACDLLKPAPSDYRKTIYYNTYDVTRLMADSFAVGIIVGNGRYFAMRQHKPYKNTTFGLPKCRLNIVVEYADGKTERFVTDDTWRVSASGAIRANNEYDGEEYDARMELEGWLTTDYDDSHWMKAERTALPEGTLCGQTIPAMRAGEAMLPVKAGKSIYDFGQNMAGFVSFVPKGKAGDTIRVRYAERLDSTGQLYTENLRHARSTDIYVCNGREEGLRWQPSFVTHGFRYVEVCGLASDVEAHVVTDLMEQTGHFECSDTILNKVIQNARWGILSNYRGMPVDCPQRDERQPWLGDRTVGSLGESFLFGNERLYTKWMRDICEAQRSDGVIPDVAPAYWNYYSDNVTWPAALPFGCDMLWRQYGNDEAIRQSYPALCRWVRHHLEENQRDGLIVKDKYGDWCMPPERLEQIHSQDPDRQTDGMLISTAYMIRILQLMEQFARMQSFNDEADGWLLHRTAMIEAFNHRFLTVRPGSSPRPGHVLFPDSTFYGNNTATANLLALAFGIVPDSLKTEIAKQVVVNVLEKNNGHVPCGVIGISWLLRTLTDCGFADVAWLIATQKTYPSWGYMAEQEATTIWELWNGDKASPRMNSGNHVMLLGDLLTWCFQYLAGISPLPPPKEGVAGSISFSLPVIQDCSFVNADYTTPYGQVKSHWRKTLQQLHWEVTIPCNTSADICLPDGTVKHVGSGSYSFDVAIPTADPRIVKDEFVYAQDGPFPSVHATTIVERKNGDLVCAYFGGSYEGCPDVCIWTSIKKKGSDAWSQPVMAADGVFTSHPSPLTTPRKACYNPVLFEMPSGELWLFFKIGANVQDWTGWLTKSRDGGRTWSQKEPLPEGFLGPIKNKPVLIGDRLVCGSSTEKGGWKFHVEIYNLKTKQWKYVGPVEAGLAAYTNEPDKLKPIGCIQPSILQLKDGRLMVLLRTRNGKLARSYSSDQGDTWTPVELTDLPNNQSGTDAVTLRDGRQVLIYNDFETITGTKKGPRTPLSIAVSEDDGLTWQKVLTLEDSPIGQYSYPAIIEGRDGTLHTTYTWRRQRVAYKRINL